MKKLVEKILAYWQEKFWALFELPAMPTTDDPRLQTIFDAWRGLDKQTQDRLIRILEGKEVPDDTRRSS